MWFGVNPTAAAAMFYWCADRPTEHGTSHGDFGAIRQRIGDDNAFGSNDCDPLTTTRDPCVCGLDHTRFGASKEMLDFRPYPKQLGVLPDHRGKPDSNDYDWGRGGLQDRFLRVQTDWKLEIIPPDQISPPEPEPERRDDSDEDEYRAKLKTSINQDPNHSSIALCRAPIITADATTGAETTIEAAKERRATTARAVFAPRTDRALTSEEKRAHHHLIHDQLIKGDLSANVPGAVVVIRTVIDTRGTCVRPNHHPIGSSTDLCDAVGSRGSGDGLSIPFVPFDQMLGASATAKSLYAKLSTAHSRDGRDVRAAANPAVAIQILINSQKRKLYASAVASAQSKFRPKPDAKTAPPPQSNPKPKPAASDPLSLPLSATTHPLSWVADRIVMTELSEAYVEGEAGPVGYPPVLRYDPARAQCVALRGYNARWLSGQSVTSSFHLLRRTRVSIF